MIFRNKINFGLEKITHFAGKEVGSTKKTASLFFKRALMGNIIVLFWANWRHLKKRVKKLLSLFLSQNSISLSLVHLKILLLNCSLSLSDKRK